LSRDLDTIARRAAENLKTAVESAPLQHPFAPVQAPARRRPSLRLVLLTAALVLGSAVATALVFEPAPEAPQPTTPTTSPTPPVSLIEPVRTPTVVTTTVPPSTTWSADTTPPLLEITSPPNGAEVHEPEVTFLGTTEPGAVVTAGENAADVAADGSWSITLILAKGTNQVGFTARDAAGNVARAAITLRYVIVEATTTTTKPVEIAPFEANATYFVCTLTPPYDVYYGKGKPSSTVYVQSEYGSGSVVVNAEGTWELQTFFPEAPPNQPFLVSVYDNLGREKAFEFVYQPG